MNTYEACKALVQALLKVTSAVYHDEANEEPEEYIVWSEAFTGGMRASNRKVEKSYSFVVNIFTTIECSTIAERTEEVFDDCEFAYRDLEYLNHYKDGYTMITTTVEVTA